MRYARTIVWACVAATAASFGGVAGAGAQGHTWPGQGQNPWQQGHPGPAFVRPPSPQAAFTHGGGVWRPPVAQHPTWSRPPFRPPVVIHRPPSGYSGYSGYSTFIPGQSAYYAPYTQTYSQGWVNPNYGQGYGWQSISAYNAAFQQGYQQGFQAGYAQAMQECGR